MTTRSKRVGGIAGEKWPGLAKLIEEAGEVIQVCGKLIETGGSEEHWDGTNLRERLEEELADLNAARLYVILHARLDVKKMDERTKTKVNAYAFWREEG